MKRIIATTIIAVLLSVISLSAQEVKATYHYALHKEIEES